MRAVLKTYLLSAYGRLILSEETLHNVWQRGTSCSYAECAIFTAANTFLSSPLPVVFTNHFAAVQVNLARQTLQKLLMASVLENRHVSSTENMLETCFRWLENQLLCWLVLQSSLTIWRVSEQTAAEPQTSGPHTPSNSLMWPYMKNSFLLCKDLKNGKKKSLYIRVKTHFYECFSGEYVGM